MPHLTPTVTVLELIWTLVSGVGALAAFAFARDAWKDRQVQAHAGLSDSRMALAMTHLVIAGAISIMLAMHFPLGLLAMSVPSNPAASPISYVITGGLILGEVLLVGAVIYIQRVRRAVLDRERIETTRMVVQTAERAAQRLLEVARVAALQLTETARIAAEKQGTLETPLADNTQAHIDGTAATRELTAVMDEQARVADVREDAAQAREQAAVERHDDLTNGEQT